MPLAIGCWANRLLDKHLPQRPFIKAIVLLPLGEKLDEVGTAASNRL